MEKVKRNSPFTLRMQMLPRKYSKKSIKKERYINYEFENTFEKYR